MASETTGQINAAPGSAKPQPVAMEIPVTVNGASTVAGSDKRQPFSETTQTVLVFGSGAVIRLAAAVGPGQLLFVTNEKSKQEVVCQVVKTKQNGNGAGYVELKFTEATTDFWGIRAPGSGAAPPTPAPAAGAIAAPSQTIEHKLADLKASIPAATQPSAVQVAFVPPVVATALPPAAQPVAQANEIQAAPVVPAQPPTAPKVPTLSEFLTQGSNGLELKARERQKTAPAESRETTIAVLTEEKSASGRITAAEASGDHDNERSLSAALGVSPSPAPGSASFDLSADLPAEEVKIPSWLEPLARNSALAETKQAETKATESKALETKALEISSVDAQVEESISLHTPAEAGEQQEAAVVLAGEGRAPNFGTSLALDSKSDGSGKGLKIVLAIAALLLAAAAVWYWFVNQTPKVSAGGFGTVAEKNAASIPAPSAGSSVSAPAENGTTNSVSEKHNLTPAQPAEATTADVRPLGRVSNASLPATNIAARSAAPSNNLVDSPVDPVEEPAKKPSLGQVRLAAPKVTRNDAAGENGTVEPGLALNAATPADSTGLSLLANKGKGPAAPLPIGGDVKVAKLISSMPPVYPQMARAQRVSGDVTIDAFIDANGRVSTTRVISGPALLHDAATSAVKQWKYQPATLNGVATATHLTVTVQFRLQ